MNDLTKSCLISAINEKLLWIRDRIAEADRLSNSLTQTDGCRSYFADECASWIVARDQLAEFRTTLL